jgi:hypothetical protein
VRFWSPHWSPLGQIAQPAAQVGAAFSSDGGRQGGRNPDGASAAGGGFFAYLESHARRAYGCVASRPVHLAATLGQKLRRGRLATDFRIGDVYLQGWVLVDAGWVRPCSARMGGKGGAPREAFMVNPAIYSQ